MLIGVLAVQGAFAAHIAALARLGVETREIRQRSHLDGIDGLVMPGGESTTITMMIDRLEMREPLTEMVTDGLAVFGTCAGAIVMASDVLDGRADQWSFGAIDITVRRNGYGRQVDSFEADLEVAGLSEKFHAAFIRAPVIETVGRDVDVLASVREQPVLVADGSVMMATFHPELGLDTRIHARWLSTIR